MKIVFPISASKYVDLQCNNSIPEYTECPEISSIRDFLAALKPENVLEVGAGLGRVSVFLFKTYGWLNTKFHLLDGDSGNKQICYVHSAVSDHFYNSIKASKEFCLANGIPEENLILHNAEKDDWKDYEVKYDLCYSFKAIGFHWPVTGYLDIIYPMLAKGAYLIFEIREPRNKHFTNFNNKQLRDIDPDKYETVDLIIDTKYPILILRKKKEHR